MYGKVLLFDMQLLQLGIFSVVGSLSDGIFWVHVSVHFVYKDNAKVDLHRFRCTGFGYWSPFDGLLMGLEL